MKITTIGLDLAKSVFQVHGADAQGKAVLKKQLKRAQMLPFFARLEPCKIAMEACGSGHYWARKLGELGHQVQLIAPQYVKPYVRRNKNDAADAAAICEAASRPDIPSVPIKSVEQQAILSVHRARQGFVKARTAQGNQIRGLLAEFGHTVPKGIKYLYERVPQIIEDADNDLPDAFRVLMLRLLEHLRVLDEQVLQLERQIQLWHRQNEASKRLAEVPGIGPLTATALVASIGDARQFANARQLAAWLGLVPRQHSTGGRQVLLGISKRGDVYLRTLLIHGARAVVRITANKPQDDSWLHRLLARRHKNVAAVALANKNARTVWALLVHGRRYQSNWQQVSHAQAPVPA